MCRKKPAARNARGFFIAGIFLHTLFLFGCSSQQTAPEATSPLASEVVFNAMQQAGKPYRYGGSSPQTGFDCSGLIQYTYRNAAGLAVPRTVSALYAAPYPSVNRQQLQSGDIVIFATSWRNKPDHAGIYVGEQRFVHAPSTGGKVRVDSLQSDYWNPRFLAGKRILRAQ
jgi:cell wall-associated NlpC family hydrolase